MAEFKEVIKQKEIWKDVVGFEGLYQVSDLGNIRNNKNETLKQNIVRGYRHLVLYKNKKQYNKQVHRLVAEAFLDKSYIKSVDENDDFTKICVNHKDENKENNNVKNLEWGTYRYNINYGTCKDRGIATRKENGTYDIMSKTVYRYDLDGNYIDSFRSTKEAMRVLEVKDVANACRGLKNSAGGYLWRYYKTDKIDGIQKHCFQFTMQGDFIQEFNSVADANKYLGKKNGHINECCNGNRKSAYGFKWSWNKEYKEPKEVE